MRIHHLNCGTFCPMSQLFINGRGSPLRRGRLVCHCLLIETGDGLVLVDTGLGTQDIAQPMERLPGPIWQFIMHAQLRIGETALHQVLRLGYDHEDVRHIVLTHLDFDHAGGLADFPHAKVHVFQMEHTAATHRLRVMDRQRYAPPQFAHRPDWALHQVRGETWRGFDSVAALPGDGGEMPEILLIPLLGHSRGHCGVAVQSDNGWILHSGDALFYHGEFNSPHRHCPIGLRIYENVFQFDRRQRLYNQHRLREFANSPASGDVQLICSHDPDIYDALTTQAAEPAMPAARFAYAH